MIPALIVVVTLLTAALSVAQEPQPPAFPAQAEAITVDAVVLDKDGRPVRGLAQSDFTVLEDGKPQLIVGFESRDLAVGASKPAATAAAGLPRAEGEEAAPGRTMAFIVDDLGLDVRGKAAIDAIRRWILDNSDPRDELTLVTTSGDVDWRGRLETGRGEALRQLSAIRFRRPPLSFFKIQPATAPYPRPIRECPFPSLRYATRRTSDGVEGLPDRVRQGSADSRAPDCAADLRLVASAGAGDRIRHRGLLAESSGGARAQARVRLLPRLHS